MIGLFVALTIVMAPGAARPLSKHTVCTTKWGLDQRHVTLAMKKAVAKRDGVPWRDHQQYVVDHVIPRELAGADVLANLWMQERHEAKLKDRDETRLHVAVCRGQMTLTQAQTEIRFWKAP